MWISYWLGQPEPIRFRRGNNRLTALAVDS
jgi:hypothetical protein